MSRLYSAWNMHAGSESSRLVVVQRLAFVVVSFRSHLTASMTSNKRAVHVSDCGVCTQQVDKQQQQLYVVLSLSECR